jgi:N-acetylmuramoyl-L-alanine amidase
MANSNRKLYTRSLITVLTLLASTKALALAPLIYIDPGHTLEFPGSIGVCGTQEVFVNDALASQLGTALRADGFRVEFSRPPNSDKSKIAPHDGRETPEALKARGEKANTLGANLFVSIHHDSIDEKMMTTDANACPGQNIANPKVISQEFLSQPDVQVGFNVFFMRNPERPLKTERSLSFAKMIGTEFIKLNEVPSTYHIPEYESSCGSCKIEDRNLGVMSRTLGVLRETKMPSVLIEVANLRIEKQEINANSPAQQAQIVQALKTAIKNYFNSLPKK